MLGQWYCNVAFHDATSASEVRYQRACVAVARQECPELESQSWFAELVMFGAGSDPAAETEDSIRDDPDCLLVSRVLERVVLPKVTGTCTFYN